MEYYNNPKSLQGTGAVFKDGSQRFLVDGHHRKVAQVMLGGKGRFYLMPTNATPSATNVYWSKEWYQFWRTAIEIIN